MAGNAAIWRADTLGAEASNQSDIIEFDQQHIYVQPK